ncbi:MAG TPA: hypothetical protein VGQ09_00230 [Chitinophagaceae bacterium]|jgi:hypothetical protein|nr:hypothetical protein [Chitinophagaceae bacterium]
MNNYQLMRRTLAAVFLLSVFIAACSKSKDEPYPGSTDEIKASVSEKGGAVFSFYAKSSATVFSKTVHSSGDVSIIISGNHSSSQHVLLNLYNITTTGTYAMGGSGAQFVQGQYIIGDIGGGGASEGFLVQPPASTGTITITVLTDKTITGTFSMTCTGTTGAVQVNSGSFKGTFL